MDNEVLKALRERRSIRSFKAEQITNEELQTVLESGTWAPTGKGLQSPYIVAVQNAKQLEWLRKENAKLMEVSSDSYYGAPTIVLVFAPQEWSNNVKDGSLVLGNMMLAAHSLGLGSCWINREEKMFESLEGQQLMLDWGLPEGLIGIGALALGYPSSYPKTIKPRKADYYRIIK